MQDEEPDVLEILKKADDLLTEEKSIKKQVKDDTAKLHIKTKKTIEALTDDVARELIKNKWITPLVQNIGK